MKKFRLTGKPVTDNYVVTSTMSNMEYFSTRPKIGLATDTFCVSVGEEKKTEPRASFTVGELTQVKPIFSR